MKFRLAPTLGIVLVVALIATPLSDAQFPGPVINLVPPSKPAISAPAITITHHGVSTPQCSNTASTTCVGPTIAVTAGQKVAVESFACGNNCSTAGGPLVGSISAGGGATGAIGSCAEFALGPNPPIRYGFAVDSWLCTVTASGNITPTVTYAVGGADGTNGYFGFVYAQAISNAGGDDGIGNVVFVDNGASISVSTNGNTSMAGDLCLSWMGGGGSILTLNETVLDYADPTAPPVDQGTQYQIAGATGSGVTAIASSAAAGSQIGEIVCLKR